VTPEQRLRRAVERALDQSDDALLTQLANGLEIHLATRQGMLPPAVLEEVARFIAKWEHSTRPAAEPRSRPVESGATIAKAFPIIPHESAGVDCCGCIVVNASGRDAELVCNECGAVVGVLNIGILRDLTMLIDRKSEAD
jgi:hypothetical protein